MPSCPNCGSHTVNPIRNDEWRCADCEAKFYHDGDDQELSDDMISDSLDMQEFEDRISPLGDD